jgi:hypothetical protein
LPLSKYLPYLPAAMRQSVVAEHVLDFGGLQRAVARGVSLDQKDETGDVG